MKWKRSIYTYDNRSTPSRPIFRYDAESENDKHEQRSWYILNDYYYKGGGASLHVKHHPQCKSDDIGDYKNLKKAKEIAEMLDKEIVEI